MVQQELADSYTRKILELRLEERLRGAKRGRDDEEEKKESQKPRKKKVGR